MRTSYLWTLSLFLAPGVACSFAGFIFLFSPYYRPNLGAALYFGGFALMLAGGFAAAISL